MHGCTVPAGARTLHVPGGGSIKIERITKAALVSQAAAYVILYQFDGAQCWQGAVDEKHASSAKSSGLLEGTCAAQGYTAPAGDHTLFRPASGSIKLGFCAEAPMVFLAEADVTLHKFNGAECGQVTLNEKYTSAAKSIGGSSAGTCPAQHFTVLAKDHMMYVPDFGLTKMELFTKTALVSQAGAAMTRYKITGAKHGQATLDQQHASAAKSFAGLSGGVCAVQGRTVPVGDQTLDVPGSGSVKSDLLTKAAMGFQAEADVIPYKFDGAKCGQVTLDEKYTSAAKSSGGFSEGTCAAQGHTVLAGDQTMYVPDFGSIKVDVFTKAAMVAQAEAHVTRYKITGAKGGQTTLDLQYASAVKSSAGSPEGTCAAQGCTTPAGDQTLDVPASGSTKSELFTKAAMVLLIAMAAIACAGKGLATQTQHPPV